LVRDIKEHTLSAEDAVCRLITNKKESVHHVHSQPPEPDYVKLKIIQVSGWGTKVQRRRTEGTGRMRYLKTVARRAKNGFRAGT